MAVERGLGVESCSELSRLKLEGAGRAVLDRVAQTRAHGAIGDVGASEGRCVLVPARDDGAPSIDVCGPSSEGGRPVPKQDADGRDPSCATLDVACEGWVNALLRHRAPPSVGTIQPDEWRA
jgi:hypothetical protein